MTPLEAQYPSLLHPRDIKFVDYSNNCREKSNDLSNAASARDEDCEASVFCYGRLLHDVQVHRIFPDSRDFLELWTTKPSQIIASKYREIRRTFKLREQVGREALKGFIKENFINRSCYELVPPPDWKAVLPFDQKVREYYRTYNLMRLVNRKWTSSLYNMTEDARESIGFHSSLPTKHPFYGSANSLDYTESWWIFQGLLASGMLRSAKQLIENLCDLVQSYGHVPAENRVYFIGRTGPPFLAVMLETYFNVSGDGQLITRLLPYAELDLHSWVHLTTRKVVSAWDVLLVVSNSTFYPSKPRPERYLEDWKRKNLGASSAKGMTVEYLIWDSEPPRGVISVELTSITEWASRVLSRLCLKFGAAERAPVYSLISSELSHTLDVLLYNRKNKQWMDYSSSIGHLGDVSLWPVYTGVRPWQEHFKVPSTLSLEDALVAVVVLQKAGKGDHGRKITSAVLSELGLKNPPSLRESAIAIALLEKIPEVVVTGVVPPSIHTRIILIAVPMLVTTIVFIPFIFVKIHISG